MLLSCGNTYSGKIAVKGNEPFTYLALVTDKGDMKITGPLKRSSGRVIRACALPSGGPSLKKAGALCHCRNLK